MTISFSYAYLNGFDRLIVRGSSDSRSEGSEDEGSFVGEGSTSPPVVIAVQRSSREISPRRTVVGFRVAVSEGVGNYEGKEESSEAVSANDVSAH